MWNVHKRVCGPGKANPFTWPLLTKAQSLEIIEHMDESTGHLADHSPERSTVAKALGHFMGIPRDKVPVRPLLLSRSRSFSRASADSFSLTDRHREHHERCS